MSATRKPGRNFLFLPGPTNIPDRILRAMHIAMEDHRSSDFPKLTLPLYARLKGIFKTREGQVIIFPSSGTGAWESALTNTLAPGNKVLIARFGQFHAAKHPALLYVDGVSSIASIDFRFDDWGVDFAINGSQKGLMLPAGLGIVCASKK